MLLALCFFSAAAIAEMDAEEYRPQGTLSNPAERERVEKAIEAERAAEAGREAERIAQEKLELERQALERVKRPYAERLMEVRCGLCHAPNDLSGIGHTWPGWYLTISRMRYLNGAALTHEESLLLTEHLSENRPAGTVRAFIEYAAIAVTSLLALALRSIRRKRNRRKGLGRTRNHSM